MLGGGAPVIVFAARWCLKTRGWEGATPDQRSSVLVCGRLWRQFTQQDPIGIAGGLNLYGFAGGDPVNFSDPFGLSACDPPRVPCRVSDAGIAFITQHEGFRANVYEDVAGYETTGFGHRVMGGEQFAGPITRAQGMAILQDDLVQRVNPGLDMISVPLSQNQVDALGSFIFNVGVTAFRNSTLLKKLNAGDLDAVPDELRRWNRAGGKIQPGLVNRREDEIELFTKSND